MCVTSREGQLEGKKEECKGEEESEGEEEDGGRCVIWCLKFLIVRTAELLNIKFGKGYVMEQPLLCTCFLSLVEGCQNLL